MYQTLDYSLENSQTPFKVPRMMLSRIRANRNNQSVPDVSLECTEIIDNWDDLDSCYTSIYSPNTTDKIPTVSRSDDLDKHELYYSYPPPNSPANASLDEEYASLYNNKYVNSLLQIWKDSDSESSCSSQESTQAVLSDDGLSMQSSDDHYLTAFSCSQTSEVSDNIYCKEELKLKNCPQFESGGQIDSVADNSLSEVSLSEVSFQDSVVELLPVSQSSSRSVSPAEIEAISHSVLGMSFDNLRSISPRIMRSPSPISSRSSSPRFVRSPSPFHGPNNSFPGIQMDDSSDGLVFYEDRFIYRSISPTVLMGDNHRVPDVDMEFQDTVSMYDEFPSFTSYSRRRFQNSCQDQVVPEFIEE